MLVHIIEKQAVRIMLNPLNLSGYHCSRRELAANRNCPFDFGSNIFAEIHDTVFHDESLVIKAVSSVDPRKNTRYDDVI